MTHHDFQMPITEAQEPEEMLLVDHARYGA